MPEELHLDERFGGIAIDKEWINQENLDRALVIRRCIFNRTKVHTPIGKVLQKMGLLTEEQVELILSEQKAPKTSPGPPQVQEEKDTAHFSDIFDLIISDDKIAAFLSPTGVNHRNVALGDIRQLLTEHGIAFGVISDELLSAYLKTDTLAPEPFKIAAGIPPETGNPPEIQYHFDTDPLRIGTLKEDGTMDWKDRGEIPQVAEGDLLVEKVGGDPGSPGTNVFGEEVPPPRVKDPKLKTNKGAQASKDGLTITAKISGIPRLEADGRVAVYNILPIEGDIGLETGHVDFDGYIEVKGSVTTGYEVKGKSLSAKEIQNATVEMSEDVVTYGGVYGSKLKVGGSMKANHVHHCTIELLGDLVVEKEIYGCTIETNGQVIIIGGKIIKVGAKKGIQVMDIGTTASRPSEITVGVDHKFSREIKALKENLAQLEEQKSESETAIGKHKEKIDALGDELGKVAQEQDGVMVQKRQLEEKLIGPNPIENPQKRQFLDELIEDLSTKYEELDQKVHAIMTQDEQIRNLVTGLQKTIATIDRDIEKAKEDIGIAEEAAKIDPGVPVIKANGIVFSKTLVIGPHKKLSIPQEMKRVSIIEAKDENNQYSIKISPLR